MENIMHTALCACFIGIISAVAGMIYPSEKTEGYIKLIMSLIFIITVISGVSSADFDDILPAGADIDTVVAYADRSEEYFIKTAEKNAARSIEGYLTERNITADNISVDIDISENGCIYINKVTAVLDNIKDKADTEKYLRQAVGEEVTADVIISDKESESYEVH